MPSAGTLFTAAPRGSAPRWAPDRLAGSPRGTRQPDGEWYRPGLGPARDLRWHLPPCRPDSGSAQAW